MTDLKVSTKTFAISWMFIHFTNYNTCINLHNTYQSQYEGSAKYSQPPFLENATYCNLPFDFDKILAEKAINDLWHTTGL